MRHNKGLDSLLSRSLLGSALLTFVLLAHQGSLGEGRVIATYNSVENDNNNNNNSPYYKRSPQEHLPQSPYTKSGSLPAGKFGGNSVTTRKRSLFSHVNSDIVVEEDGVRVVILQQQPTHSKSVPAPGKLDLVPEPALAPPVHRVAPGDKVVIDEEEYEVSESAEVEPEDLDFWGDDERRTLIEPRYPSIDLFDEEVEEMFELGEDGFLREMLGDDSGYRRNVHRDDPSESKGHHDQVWMVDEWEEELEGDMDELMDWAEEDGELNNRRPIKLLRDNNNVMGSPRLHDRGSIRNALLDEDEDSPFQRLFSDSWLF